MNTLAKILAVALLMLFVQACNTTGSTTSAGATLPADPAAAPGTPSADLKGEFVPAVVGIPADPGPTRTYRIGPYDLLKIEVFQVDELSSEERVNEEGFVVMPLIGNVKVGGLTPREAEQDIANRLGESYLQNPQVNIFVAEYASQKVTVTGNVKKPGVFPLAGETTLMQAIAMAGGLDEVANKDEILVFRKQPTGKVNAYVVDMEAIEEGRLTDPAIVGDDRIVVPKSGAAVLTRAIGNVLTGWAVRAPLY
jgi:polysaccharide export outer membrane protein